MVKIDSTAPFKTTYGMVNAGDRIFVITESTGRTKVNVGKFVGVKEKDSYGNPLWKPRVVVAIPSHRWTYDENGNRNIVERTRYSILNYNRIYPATITAEELAEMV